GFPLQVGLLLCSIEVNLKLSEQSSCKDCFLSFDLDTVFDVNSIVSEVLFAILREEVKYVHTDTDLLAMERSARGKTDIVLGYVRSLGTQDHRSLMETAYVYSSKHQFILITGGPVLKADDSSVSSRVWFLHCRAHGGSPASERCPSTRMRWSLSALKLHSFLQLMEAPLSEVYVDPASVPPPQFPHQLTPQVFLFSRPETELLDLASASALAWRLRGLALLLLVHRWSPAVKTSDEYNAAYRLQDEEEEEEEDEEEKEEGSFLFVLDDEVAADVFEKRASQPDTDSITQLTSGNFHAEIARSSLTVALFYLKWDAVSMEFLSSFIDVAERLVNDVQMSAVDCGEWTDLCGAQPGTPVPFRPIATFPSVLLLRPQQPAQRYRGMLGGEALHRFIMMSRTASPLLLSTQEEVTSFLQEADFLSLILFQIKPDAGGCFSPGSSVFAEAAKSLRGEVLSGLLSGEPAAKWYRLFTNSIFRVSSCKSQDFLLFLPARQRRTKCHRDLWTPELTVENLPSFLSLGKALLLLFVGEEDDEFGRRQSQALVEELRGVRTERYLTCWIHLGRTPAGMSVLGSYLGSMPPLPALVLTHLPTGDEIYQYPPSTPIVASSVLRWLQKVEDGTESPAGTLGDDSWPPAFQFYDFLKVMDMQEPDSTEQEAPTDDEEVDVEEHLVAEQLTDHHPDIGPKFHSEL
uniref:Thioredoxin domain containing 16 n=1 Tax=Kryptolebias marmoratus TaxID=37003 RepID=A0A3Q3EH36_KRYMA